MKWYDMNQLLAYCSVLHNIFHIIFYSLMYMELEKNIAFFLEMIKH